MGFRKKNARKRDSKSESAVILGKPASQLTKEDKKLLSARMAEIKTSNGSKNTVQSTIPFLCIYKDGVCQVSENFFSLPEEVSTALDNLNNAYRSLRLKSMEELDSLIIQAENYSPVFFQYTESSFNELENALLQAKEVQQKELPSEREVQSAKKNLNDSISALQQVMKYDVNNDGKITLSDIISVQRWLISDYSLTQRNIYIADFNNDGVITLTDVILFQRYLLRN